MSRASELIGKELQHSSLGKVQVIEKKKNSRTIVTVEILDRGKGWSESEQRYKGVRNRIGWYRGENRAFGNLDDVHINELI